MANWQCGGPEGCGAVWSQWLSRCPRCHRTDLEEQQDMAKITRAAGASNAYAEPGQPGYSEPVTEAVSDTAEAVSGEPEVPQMEQVTPVSGDDSGSVGGAPEGQPEASADAETGDGYDSRTVAALQAELRDRGLPISGPKQDLVARLDAADQAAGAAPDPDGGAAG